MKRAVTLAIFAMAFALIPVTSAWAVWEGNAGIAAVGEFPGSGLFIRSDMFPKNTVVEIRNLENEKTAKAVVTGSSGVPGLVAMLSPQTADALGMKSGSVARVRISVPTVVERPAAGTYVEETSAVSEDPDANPAIAATETVAATDAVALTDVSPAEAIAAADAAAATDAVAPAEAIEPTAAMAEAEAPATEPVEENAEPAEIAGTDETAESVENVEPETNASIAETEADTDIASETADAPIDEIAPEAVETAEAADTPEIVPAIVAVPESAEATEPVDEPELAITDETAPVDEIVPAPEAEAVTALDAAAVVAEAAPEAEPETTSDETIVTLVPTDALPPEAPSVEPSSIPLVDAIAEATPEEPAIIVPEVVAPVVVAPIPVAPQEKPAIADVPAAPAIPAAVVAPAASGTSVAASTAAVAMSTADLPIIASLSKGSYYIQIGAYADAKNVRSILDKYGKKYPVAVEKTTNKNGECLKVYIGPVMKDEYGAVLEKFKANGFKDAFVRKGQ